jgi:putative oxidoreductase
MEAMDKMQAYGALFGRILLGSVFIVTGIVRLSQWSPSVDYLAGMGIPVVPVLLAVALLLQFLAALCVLTGFMARAGAIVLALLTIPATVIFHSYWTYPAGVEQQMQALLFLKNIAIFGGLMVVASLGPGPIALTIGKPKTTTTAQSQPA